MDSILQYGDSIMLYSNKENNYGFIYTTGFIENGVYLKGIEKKLDLEKIKEKEFSNINSRDFVFKITPKLNYDFHKEYKKTLKKYKKLEKVENKNTENKDNLKDLKDFLFQKIKKLNERLKEEKLLNKSILEKSEKLKVTYGSYVQLMHLDSESYICSKGNCSDSEKIGYKIYLNNWFSSGMIFKILPKFNSRQNGDFIQINDDIVLQNIKNDYFLNINEEFGKPIIQNDKINPFLSPMVIDDLSGNLKMIFLSQENNSSFNIILNRKVSKKTDFIKGLDMIYWSHSEIQGYLNADYKFNSNDIEVYIKKYIGEHKEEELSLNSIWVIEHKELDNLGRDFEIGNDKFIYLRHFISGRYIKFKNKELNYELNLEKEENINFIENSNHISNKLDIIKFNEFSCILDNEEINEKINFIFEPIMKFHDKIYNGSTYHINTHKLECYLKSNQNKLIVPNFEQFKKEIDEELSNDFEFLPLEDKDLDSNRYEVNLEKELSSEDAFIINKISEEEKNNILFIRSGLSVLIYFSNIFKNNLEKVKDIYLDVEKILIKIIYFLFDYEDNFLTDIYNIEGNPIIERQKIIKDIQLIDILVDIIYYPFKKRNDSNYDIQNKDEFLFKILSLSYTCLRYSIKEYRPSELYSSQWMNLFLNDTLNNKKKKDVQAGKMLTELIDNNKRILENRIKAELIKKIIDFMYENEKDEKFINILIAICICDDEPMISNQKDISKFLLKNTMAKNLLLFDIEENNEDNYLYLKTLIPQYELINLKDLPNKKQFFEYITSLTMLLSYLCKNRNYIAIDILKKKYSFDICFKIINSVHYHNYIKKGFVSLIENLWIDVTPFQKEKIPKLIIFAGENNDFKDNDLNIEEKEKFSKLKSFIQNFMKNLNERESCINNSLYLAIFDLCIKMLNLGFFNDTNSLELLAESIIKYLKGMNEKIKTEKEIQDIIKIEKSAEDFNNEIKISQVRIKLLYLLEQIIYIKQNPLIEKFVKVFINDNELNKNEIINENNIKQFDNMNKMNKLFYDFLVKNIKLDYLFSQNKYEEIIVELTNLIHIGDKKAKEICLKLLKILNSLNKMIVKYLKFIQIIDSNYVLNDYKSIKTKSIKLNSLSDSYEIWSIEKVDKNKKKELKAILYDLLSYMFPKLKLKNFNINNVLKKKYNILNEFLNLFCFKNENTEFFQILFKNLSIYDYLFEILNYDAEVNKLIDLDFSTKKFKLIYIFLIKCLEKNKKNKKFFTKFINIMENHIKRNITNQSLFLYNKLLFDNYLLIKTDKFNGVVNFIMSQIKWNKENYLKVSFFLNCLSKLIKYKGKEVKNNQIQIISMIIDSNFLLNFINDNLKNLLKIKNNYKEAENILYLEKKILIYYFNDKIYLCIEILNLLCESSFGKNSFTEKICQNLISINDIFDILKLKENKNLILKLYIIKFFYFAYLLNEKNSILLNDFFIDIFKIFIFQFEEIKIIYNSMGRNSNNTYFLLINNPISFYEIINSFFKYLGSCLIILCQNLIGEENSEFIENKLKTDLENLNSNLLLLLDQVYDNNLKSILNNLKTKIIQINNKIAKIELNQEKVNFIIDKKKSKRRKVTHLKSTILHTKIINLMEFSNKNFKKSDYYNKIVENELNNYVIFTFKPQKNYHKIKFQELLKGLINFFIQDYKEIPNQILNFGIFYLIKVIDVLKESNTDVRLIDLDESVNYNKALLINRQNYLVSANICKLICNLWSNEIPKKLLKNTLILAIYILFGGNQKTQESFHENFKIGTFINRNNIIEKINLILSKSFENVKKKMKQINYESLKEYYYSFEEIKNVNKGENKFKEIEIDIEICELIFRFLQLLCEGHNKLLQNFLRNQNESKDYLINNVNIISKSTSYWGSYIKFVNFKSSKLGFKILEFLIEAIQGPCIENQKELFDNKIIDFSRDFMNDFLTNRDFFARNFNQDNKNIIEEMITLNIKLLNSLIEGNIDKDISNSLGQNIEFEFLISKLKIFFYGLFNNKINPANLNLDLAEKFIKKDSFEGKNAEAFNIYFFIKTINEKTLIYEKKIKELNGEDKIIFEFFNYHSAHIEFIFNGELHKIYFVIQPACRYLDENTKNIFLDKLKRDSPNEKITDLINKSGKIFDIMDHMSELTSKFKIINTRVFKKVRDLCLWFIFLINILIFFTFENKIQNNKAELYIPETFQTLILVLGIIYIILCMTMTVLWTLINGKLVFLEEWREKFIKYKKFLLSKKNDNENKEEFDEILLNLNKNINEISMEDKIKIIRYYNLKKGYRNSIPKLEYYQNYIYFLLTNNNFLFFLLLIIFSIFAANKNYILYCIPMLDIINRFDTLGNVIKAITFNKKQLLLTAFFGIIIIYFFAIFAFLFVDETFFMFDVGETGENLCSTMIQCFLTIMSLGPRSSGSVGDILIRPSFETSNLNRFYSRYIFDITIFFVLNITTMKLIFGIIIDTFGELRDKKNLKEHDKNNICFICSLDKYIFDKNSDGFNNHLTRDHNVWNYIFFMYYLKKKPETEFNGNESYIYNKISKEDISWVPIGKTLTIKDPKEEKNKIEDKIKIAHNELKKLEEKLLKLKNEMTN